MARILVVENEPNVQLLLQLLLEEQGHEVIVTSDGYLAVELYVERSVSLVICNLLNPTRNGLQTIQAIKSINKAVPAVVLSGSNIIQEPEYSEAARRIGIHATFAKPFDIGEFRKCIWGILGGLYGKRPCEENSFYSLRSATVWNKKISRKIIKNII